VDDLPTVVAAMKPSEAWLMDGKAAVATQTAALAL
jgi:hypothetical protein